MFSKALMTATYKNGKPGQLTEAHEKAENHPYKKSLFKNTQIPKDLYTYRLIQHYLIIKTIETQLQNLTKPKQTEISAFFALTYLAHLWRTPNIEEDLQQLGVNPKNIEKKDIAKTTKNYLTNIEKLSPKELLAHFLMHIAGFMHGDGIIQYKFINPSNKLTTYQIPANQYDFSSAALGKSSIALYHDMMKQIDEIKLEGDEEQHILEQCHSVYETMSCVYDDLLNTYITLPKKANYTMAAIGFSIIVIGLSLKILAGFIMPSIDRMAPSMN